jgi:FKBP-type peptidyl-prolyl cis-trans isomerase
MQTTRKTGLQVSAVLLLALALAGGACAAGGFTATARGLEYRDLKLGTGAAAEVGDVATMQFAGWLEEKGGRGRQLYDSHTRNDPVSFVIGTDRVLPAWNEGIVGMRVGGKRLLSVPPELGYGADGVQDLVPPNSRLIFVIELQALRKR